MIIPIYINGPDKILPKVDSLIVPFISDVYIGEQITYDNKSAQDFTAEIQQAVLNLKSLHTKKETL